MSMKNEAAGPFVDREPHVTQRIHCPGQRSEPLGVAIAHSAENALERLAESLLAAALNDNEEDTERTVSRRRLKDTLWR